MKEARGGGVLKEESGGSKVPGKKEGLRNPHNDGCGVQKADRLRI